MKDANYITRVSLLICFAIELAAIYLLCSPLLK